MSRRLPILLACAGLALSAACGVRAATMDGLLGDLRAYLAPLVAEWSGSASEAYNTQQAKWDRGAAQIHDVLNRIGMQLSNAHDRYTTAEAQNTARFS